MKPVRSGTSSGRIWILARWVDLGLDPEYTALYPDIDSDIVGCGPAYWVKRDLCVGEQRLG